MAFSVHEAREQFHVSTGLFYSPAPLFRPIAHWRESSNQGQCSGLEQRYSVIDFTAVEGVAAAQGTTGPQPPSNQRARCQRSRVKPVSHPSWWIGLCWISSHDTAFERQAAGRRYTTGKHVTLLWLGKKTNTILHSDTTSLLRIQALETNQIYLLL